jgi:hypothetical protein
VPLNGGGKAVLLLDGLRPVAGTASTTRPKPACATLSWIQTRTGRPATGAIGLGRSVTTLRSRVPRPPASTMACIYAAAPAAGPRGKIARSISQQIVWPIAM